MSTMGYTVAVLGAAVILGTAYQKRRQLERDDVQHRENRPQDFYHGVDLSAKFTASTEEERKIYSRLQAHARNISNPLDYKDFGLKYKQVISDYKAGKKLPWK